jgi:hypothetical protein
MKSGDHNWLAVAVFIGGAAIFARACWVGWGESGPGDIVVNTRNADDTVAVFAAPDADWDDSDGGVDTIDAVPLTPDLTPYEGQRVYVERQDSSGHFIRNYMIWHVLTSGGGGWRHTTEVHHVYHSAPSSRPNTSIQHPASSHESHPTYKPTSRPVSAIKTTRSNAVHMSPSSFHSSHSFGSHH